MPPPHPSPHGAARESSTDVVRWAAFSCVLVPVVLVGYGTSLAGAAGAAFGLAAVTAVCRVLLRRSERCAGRRRVPPLAGPAAEESPGEHARHPRGGTVSHRAGRRAGGISPAD
ncbi:hypothetical protein ABZZ79_03510 [Streptomyces sp. NPDC006458]|uniref:hypothetical protein n=1 Tax=Streptomyces sp. NPDC006458 TaxID=3154302 RepID=UPI0033B19EE0